MDRVLLVTGGSKGIGAAVARLAATRGYDLAVNYNTDGAAAETIAAEAERSGVRALGIQADVSREADVEKLFAAIDKELGPLSALVCSAGVTEGPPRRVADIPGAELERVMAINAVGTMLCCREAVRRMSTKSGGDGGSIVNVSSMAATTGGRAGRAVYAASKAAVDGFTKGLAKEVATQGIRVNAIRPGVTLTPMTRALSEDKALLDRISGTIAMNRIATAEEIAAPILWLLSDEASFVSGGTLDASGGGFVI